MLACELGIFWLQPEFIVTDFEYAAINAIKSIFPSTKMKACFFHLYQNVYRKIKKKDGLTRKYGTNETFSALMKCIPCLTFLQPAEILNTFNNLKTSIPSEAEAIVKCFNRCYVNGSVKHRPNGTSLIRPTFFTRNLIDI